MSKRVIVWVVKLLLMIAYTFLPVGVLWFISTKWPGTGPFILACVMLLITAYQALARFREGSKHLWSDLTGEITRARRFYLKEAILSMVALLGLIGVTVFWSTDGPFIYDGLILLLYYVFLGWYCIRQINRLHKHIPA